MSPPWSQDSEAVALQDAPPARDHTGALTFSFANDIFAGTDNNFTAGWGFNWTSNAVEDLGDGFLSDYVDFFSFLPVVGEDGTRNHVSFGFGQSFSTSSDITDPDPPLTDQPYAGLLAGTTTLHARTEDSLHSYWLLAGIVGPSSGAEEMQKFIHAQTGSDEPLGWHTQIRDEPVLNAFYEWKHRLAGAPQEGWSWDVISGLGGGVGNAWSGAFGSVIGRVGFNLPDNFGPSVPRTGLGGNPIRIDAGHSPWRVYGFAGVDGSWVAQNVFLDGNTWKDSRSVDREPFLGTATFGLGIQKGAFALDWMMYLQTDAYETQIDSNRFGTVSVSWFF